MAEGDSDDAAFVPPAEPTRPAVDDLAQTSEMPATPRLLILDAAGGLLEEVGFDRLTESAIATRAAIDPDILHAHFANKLAILAALNDRFAARTIRVIDDAAQRGSWSQASPREVLELAVWSMLDVVFANTALVRAVLTTNDERFRDAFHPLGATIAARLGDVVGRTIGEKPSSRTLAFAVVLAIALASHVVVTGTGWTGFAFEREELYERITSAVIAYVETAAHPALGSQRTLPR